MDRRLASFRVSKLFGLYDHVLRLHMDERVTAVIGPNGVGKTICLKLIDALFNRKYSVFHSTNFDNCEYQFDDGTRIIASKEILQLELAKTDEELPVNVSFKIFPTSGEEAVYEPLKNLLSKRIPDLSHYVPFVTLIGPGLWRHDRTGERLTNLDLFERYPYRLPRHLKDLLRRDEPPAFSKVLEGVKCHLIETQRLLVMPDSDDEIQMRRGVQTGEGPQLAVERKSLTLGRQIQKVLAEYAALSQSLDRTFPSRIVLNQWGGERARDEIEMELSELEVRRKALENAGILEPETGYVTNVPENMDGALQRVISIYVEDTNKKLNIFSPLQNRIQVFEELIQKRFLDKRISIAKRSGLSVTSSDGKAIPLSALSSGEQHQLVLIFELLFETDIGDLILIDEPELSLHVAWQKSFVDDLLKIIKANPFDAIIATHSPVLIGRHYNLAVELGEQEHDQVD